MKEFLETYKEIIMSIILAIIICIIGNILNIDNTIINFLLTNIVPIAIPTLTIVFNRPRFYLKWMFFKLKNKDIKLKAEISLEEMNIDSENKYNEFINKYENVSKRMSLDVKEYKRTVGEYIGNSIVCIDTINHDFFYNFEDQKLILTVEANVSYQNFFRTVKNTSNILKKTLGELKNTGYDKSTSIITIRFIEFDNNDITNPVFKAIYKEFSPKVARLSYRVGDTNVDLTNDSIIFKSDEIDNINETINKELRFFRKKD
ncbi:Uncharacterised protein [[Clostridium] sordellii]|uniref:hypothetical protein n=1 Tax=Paraclostridium sordellii TaxID=1505 RepID=UPI0005E9DA07|nr:hypothetical protein [Paeniclostridium sordellii]CEO06008.1 Uncharacterised protein [[Clostridium] sordellii] [Paeniclostridium sordellii]